MKIGVLGFPGQVAHALSKTQPNIVEWEIQYYSRKDWDITNPSQSQTHFEKEAFDLIINAAAYTQVDRAESESDLADLTNATAVEKLGSLGEKHNCSIVHLSSDYVYHPAHLSPIKESENTNPQSVYATTKLQGDLSLLKKNINGCVIRTSWVYGPEGHNFVKTMVKLMSNHQKLNIVADQWGCPTSSIELAKFIWSYVQSNENKTEGFEILNYTQAGYTNWYEFACEIKKLAGFTTKITPIRTADYPTPAARPRNSMLDCKKVDLLGIHDRLHWKKALKQCWESL